MDNRTNLSDEIPVADAVEQDQEAASEPTAAERDIPPVEANTSDWQEQQPGVPPACGGEIVASDDRDEYRQ